MKSFRLSKPELSEPKPYVRPEWVKRLLASNHLLLHTPVTLESKSTWLLLLGSLGWLGLAAYAGYSFFTSQPLGSLLWITFALMIAVVAYYDLDKEETDNILMVWAYRLSKLILCTLGLLVVLGMVLIAYFWIKNSWEARSGYDRLETIGAAIISLLIYLIYVVARNRKL